MWIAHRALSALQCNFQSTATSVNIAVVVEIFSRISEVILLAMILIGLTPPLLRIAGVAVGRPVTIGVIVLFAVTKGLMATFVGHWAALVTTMHNHYRAPYSRGQAIAVGALWISYTGFYLLCVLVAMAGIAVAIYKLPQNAPRTVRLHSTPIPTLIATWLLTSLQEIPSPLCNTHARIPIRIFVEQLSSIYPMVPSLPLHGSS